MREIKFRGKRIDNGEWVYGYYGFKEELNKHFIMVETINLHSSSYFTDNEVIPESVGQYTGLKDKNEKELYFDDAVDVWIGSRYDDRLLVNDLESLFTVKSLQMESGATFEIVGNIHDNPELLK